MPYCQVAIRCSDMSRHVCNQHSEEMSQFGSEAPSQANVLLRNLESSTSESSESEPETSFLCDPEEDSRRSLLFEQQQRFWTGIKTSQRSLFFVSLPSHFLISRKVNAYCY